MKGTNHTTQWSTQQFPPCNYLEKHTHKKRT